MTHISFRRADKHYIVHDGVSQIGVVTNGTSSYPTSVLLADGSDSPDFYQRGENKNLTRQKLVDWIESNLP